MPLKKKKKNSIVNVHQKNGWKFLNHSALMRHKPFLETAPYLIAIFSKSYEVLPDGRQVKQYYAIESTGIATGMLITAIHNAGLVSLTHTPSPMNFLNEILGRPKNERPFLFLLLDILQMMQKCLISKRKACKRLQVSFDTV